MRKSVHWSSRCPPRSQSDECLLRWPCSPEKRLKTGSKTRMHSSRMRTARSLTVSHRKNHARPPEQPRMPPPPEQPCTPPGSNHACPPRSNHAHPPWKQPCMLPWSNHTCPPPQSNHAHPPPPEQMHTPPE